MSRPRRTTAFAQGQLDSLCGVYAVVNAVRLVTAPESKRLLRDDWLELFNILVAVLDDTVGTARAIVGGIEARPLRLALQAAVQHMSDEHEIQLRLSRLVARGNRPSVEEVVGSIAKATDAGHAVIASFQGGLDHWTVIRKTGSGRLTFFDSSGRSFVQVANCRMSYERRSGSGVEHVMHTSELWRLSRDS